MLEQSSAWNRQRQGEFFDVVERDVDARAFDLADEGAIEPGRESQLFL